MLYLTVQEDDEKAERRAAEAADAVERAQLHLVGHEVDLDASRKYYLK